MFASAKVRKKAILKKYSPVILSNLVLKLLKIPSADLVCDYQNIQDQTWFSTVDIEIKNLNEFTTSEFFVAVTHGCVIATLTLFCPDGSEASRTPTAVSSCLIEGFSKESTRCQRGKDNVKMAWPHSYMEI